VFTGSTICSHGYCHMLHLGLPVRVGGLMVYQGDLLHADANGVTSIPAEIAAEVAQAAADYMDAEGVVLDFLKTGNRDPRGYAEARKQAMDRIAELGRRVRARRATA
jgi:regulator of RNase E activity RraA